MLSRPSDWSPGVGRAEAGDIWKDYCTSRSRFGNGSEIPHFEMRCIARRRKPLLTYDIAFGSPSSGKARCGSRRKSLNSMLGWMSRLCWYLSLLYSVISPSTV